MITENSDGSLNVRTDEDGLNELADHLAVDLARDGLHVDRDRLRAQLEQFKGVVFDQKLGRLMRMVEHETIGDWRRATLEPFLRLIPNKL